jgi:hypothetical protein
MEETRRFRLRLNVYYEGVPWFRGGAVYKGTVLTDRVGTVRLYAPEGAPEPAHVDVPCHWVIPAK